MSEKLCMFCKHLLWEYDSGSDCPTCGYSGYGVMNCGKGHWDRYGIYATDDFLIDFREKILTAETCKDYKQVKP